MSSKKISKFVSWPNNFLPVNPPIIQPPLELKNSPDPVRHGTGPGVTRVYQVVDASGSMAHIWTEIVGLLDEQLKVHKEAVKDEHMVYLTTVLFSSKVLPPTIANFPVDQLEELPDFELIGAMTTLYDAIGTTIKLVDADFQDGNNEAVLFQIFTDGHENLSSEFNQEMIRNMITGREATGKWTFTFFGANQVAENTAQTLGIRRGNASSFTTSHRGVENMSAGLARQSRGYHVSRGNGEMSSRCFAGDESEKSYDIE